jgi:ADP-ribosylation factor related protein 1
MTWIVGRVVINQVHVKLWDLGGQRDLQSIWEKYYSECHGIVFVIDSCDAERLEECKDTFDRVVASDHVEGVPVVMLANKQDVEGARQVEAIKEVFNKIAERMDAQDSTVLAVSALSGEGVKEAMEWIVTRMQHNRTNRPPQWTNR